MPESLFQHVFSSEFYEIFTNTVFTGYLRATAFEAYNAIFFVIYLKFQVLGQLPPPGKLPPTLTLTLNLTVTLTGGEFSQRAVVWIPKFYDNVNKLYFTFSYRIYVKKFNVSLPVELNNKKQIYFKLIH